MRKGLRKHVAQIILPSVVFSAIVGALTGAVVFAFRLISEEVILLSARIFGFADTHLWAVPLVVLGAVAVAFLVSMCLVYSPHSRGGGIPTAVALMRGLITFHWLRNIIFVFASALFSYLCGIPLGNDEGPAVQMGTAVGSGVTRLSGKKHLAWERYLMTGGATAGFATATCAPISAVLFGIEEAHRRISPLLVMSSVSAVLSGMGMFRMLAVLTGNFELLTLFHMGELPILRLRSIWIAVIIGLVCGGFAYLFALVTVKLRSLLHRTLKHLHPFFKIAPVFAAVALIGCFFYEHHVIGTGHHLIQDLLIDYRVAWYTVLVLLSVRSLLVILSNDVGATGGLFTPLLVLGALLGSLVGDALIALELLHPAYLPLLVVIGMASFLSGAARIPVTAVAFSREVLGGADNLLFILAAVLISYVFVEVLGVTSINEIALEREVHGENKGKVRRTVDVELTVQPGCFAVGKAPRDILWPALCHVLSVRKGSDEKDSYEGGVIHEQDILRLNFTTYDPESTARELCAILGEQEIYRNAEIRAEQGDPAAAKP